MRTRIKRAAASVGLDPALYSGHFLRAGAATDLFAHRIPYYVIKKMGPGCISAARRRWLKFPRLPSTGAPRRRYKWSSL